MPTAGSSPSSNGFGSIGRDASTLGNKSLTSGGLSSGHSSGGNLLSDPWASPGSSQQGPGPRTSLTSMNGHQQTYQRSPILSGIPGKINQPNNQTTVPYPYSQPSSFPFYPCLTHPSSQSPLLSTSQALRILVVDLLVLIAPTEVVCLPMVCLCP